MLEKVIDVIFDKVTKNFNPPKPINRIYHVGEVVEEIRTIHNGKYRYYKNVHIYGIRQSAQYKALPCDVLDVSFSRLDGSCLATSIVTSRIYYST